MPELWVIWHQNDDEWARKLFGDLGVTLSEVRKDPEDEHYWEANITPDELAMDLLDGHWGRLIWGPVHA